ncbi:MAG: putative glycoside hydrolase [Candidatus Paceibacterota bacterium]
MKKFIILIIILVLIILLLLFFNTNEKSFTIEDLDNQEEEEMIEEGVVDSEISNELKERDLEPEIRVVNIPVIDVDTPGEVRSIYYTAYSAGNNNRINQAIDLYRNGEINSVIIDINGYKGFISYNSNIPEVKKYDLEDIRTPNLRETIKKLNEEGIYVIARITVFQDLAYAQVRPELAIKAPSTGEIWKDNGGQGWLDPSSKEAWNYKLAIAKEATKMGFDELNFDYIRFPSDGDFKDIEYPFWDEEKSRREVMKEFFAFLRKSLPNETLSVDLFGLTTISRDDLGIGQVIEDAYPYFNFIAPMVYPSHYANGFMNYQNPSEQPYGVVYFSMWNALKRLEVHRQNNPESRDTKLRPWLQDFNLGATYNEFMVKIQIDATKAALGDEYVGFMMWNPSNNYTRGALNPN